MMNTDRAAHSVGPLIPPGGLLAKAQAWAEHLAAINSLEHPSLPSGVSAWSTFRERRVRVVDHLGGAHVHELEPARANLLNGSFGYAGPAWRTEETGSWCSRCSCRAAEPADAAG